jgi:hypothetical protein
MSRLIASPCRESQAGRQFPVVLPLDSAIIRARAQGASARHRQVRNGTFLQRPGHLSRTRQFVDPSTSLTETDSWLR